MKQILNRLFNHQSLTREESAEVMRNIGAGMYNESQIAAFISVYLMRSIELDELIGFRDALMSLFQWTYRISIPLILWERAVTKKTPSTFQPAVVLFWPVPVTKLPNMEIMEQHLSVALQTCWSITALNLPPILMLYGAHWKNRVLPICMLHSAIRQ